MRLLFAGTEGNPFGEEETAVLDDALVSAKILDPACGSGAFPMGILLRMVELLRVLRDIPEEASVYDLKLELIKNCIYGGDIQCIAVQISKLCFFISLVCEQNPTTHCARNLASILQEDGLLSFHEMKRRGISYQNISYTIFRIAENELWYLVRVIASTTMFRFILPPGLRCSTPSIAGMFRHMLRGKRR